MFEDKNKKIKIPIDTFSTPLAPEELKNLPDMSHESVKLKLFDKVSGKDRLINFDYDGLMAESQRRENIGDLRGALDMLDIAERLVHGLDYKESGDVTFKIAETLHKISDDDNSGETKQVRQAQNEWASDWLSISDSYKQLDKQANKPEKLTNKVRRSFRLGKSAVINAFKKL